MATECGPHTHFAKDCFSSVVHILGCSGSSEVSITPGFDEGRLWPTTLLGGMEPLAYTAMD